MTTQTPMPTLLNYPRIMILNIFIDPQATSNADDLKAEYQQRARTHNANVRTTTDHIDAGFDLLVPTTSTQLDSTTLLKLNHTIKCSAYYCPILNPPQYDPTTNKPNFFGTEYPTGYYMYPRSSIIKTPFRLANSVGIIDSGYRGHLISALDCKQPNSSVIQYERLVQICAPDLCPILVNIVDTVEELGTPTARGEGGFGSTGK